jgi:uncharacterized protein (DUF1697 family)
MPAVDLLDRVAHLVPPIFVRSLAPPMALVVFLRGVNVGGHRRFRPSQLAARLDHLDAVSIGAAGTLVVRRPVAIARLRAELARQIPFDCEIVICRGKDIVGLIAQQPFGRQPQPADIVPFVSILSRRPESEPEMPLRLPPRGRWMLRIVARRDRFVCGLYRREMKAIGYLGTVDGLFGVPVTTRNWNTIAAIGKALGAAD